MWFIQLQDMTAFRFFDALLLWFCVIGFTKTENEHYDNIMYEELGNGTVIVDLFGTPRTRSLAPIFGDFNPSSRLDSCSQLGEGRFPVYGDCTKYLECVNEETARSKYEDSLDIEYDLRLGNESFTRRVVQCSRDFWFDQETGECGLSTLKHCPLGRLVPSSLIEMLPGESNGCTRAGIFPQAGCRGYITCRQTPYGFDRTEYRCAEGLLWDEVFQKSFCVPESEVHHCSVPVEEETCLRECRAGVNRVCKYKFIVHEHVSMSTVHCGNCPTNLNDCNLPGCIAAGGLQRTLVAINRQTPGPTIQVCKGDTIEVNVFNHLPSQGVTIHWHGLHQRGTPFMDGVPYVTQCPILPGTSFRYRMKADVSGTHMYHSHIGHLESDGLYGAMIVREPRLDETGLATRYDLDLPQHQLLVWHWFDRPADMVSLNMRYLNRRREGIGFLINGKGIIGRQFSPDGRRLLPPVETYHVSSGKKYRFRTIYNTAAFCPIQISIDGHRLDILATDGRPLQTPSKRVDSIILTAGERVDFVPWPIVASTHSSAFYIRVLGMTHCDDQRNSVHQYAVLRYDNYMGPVLNFPPPSYTNAIRSGLTFNLNRPIKNAVTQSQMIQSSLADYNSSSAGCDKLDGKPNKRFYIEINFNAFRETESVQMVEPQLNDISWSNPPFPLLTQWQQITNMTLCTQFNAPVECKNRQCKCAHTLLVNTGDLVEIALADPLGPFEIGHPFHLHGYAFKVVAQHLFDGPTTLSEIRNMVESNRIVRNLNGPWKDTVLAPGRAVTLIRFRANNPGYWMFHCHIGEHASLGMALTFKVGQHAEMAKAPNNFPTCGNFF